MFAAVVVAHAAVALGVGAPAESALTMLLDVDAVGRSARDTAVEAPATMLGEFGVEDVTLHPTSRLAVAQARNRDYIMSLNRTQLTCIFTAAANLSSCSPNAAVEGPPGGLGYGGACPSPGSPSAPGCNPLAGEMGLGSYYGHYLGHWLSATALLYGNTRDPAVANKSAAVVATLAAVQRAWTARYPRDGSVDGLDGDGYIFPYDTSVFRKLENLTLHAHGEPRIYSVPFYTLHKIMAGLLDQHLHVNNPLAWTTLQRLSQWVVRNVDAASTSDTVWQQVLSTEWGGMNEVMLNMYHITHNVDYLNTARHFNHWSWSAPLAAGIDDLAGNHANTHIPEVIGNMVGFDESGNATDRAIADEFFQAVTTNHSWATGGSNDGEYWSTARHMGDQLNRNTEESCTQYNLLKVARHMLRWTANSSVGDLYERALWNGILGNQLQSDPAMTSFIYMLPLGGGGVRKPWGSSNESFPCCWGTLSEQFAKLSDSIYFQNAAHDTIYINLFTSSDVVWGEQAGTVVSQNAGFPESTTSTTRITVKPPSNTTRHITVKVRIPAWATSKQNTATLNGRQMPVPAAGGWLAVERDWGEGDMLAVWFPMEVWSSRLEDDRPQFNSTMAFMYGPLVLAGLTSTTSFVPPGGAAAALHHPGSFIARNSTDGAPLTFSAVGSSAYGKAAAILLRPLSDITDEAYTVYFHTMGLSPPHFDPSGKWVPVPSSSAADLEFQGGAGPAAGPRDSLCPTGSNIRSGNPGGTAVVLIAHPLVADVPRGGRAVVTGVRLSFRYAVGYTPPPNVGKRNPVVTVELVTAVDGRLVHSLHTTPPLGNHSFDHFTGYSQPVEVAVTGLEVDNAQPLMIAMTIANNDRNLQIPIDVDGFGVAVTWSVARHTR